MVLAAPTGAAVAPVEANLPQAGKTVWRQIRPEEVHRFSLVVAPREYFRIRVHQEGADLELTLRGPGGEKLAAMDSPTGSRGPEVISWIAQSAGTHTLELRSFETKQDPRPYSVELLERRASSPEDVTRIRAQTAFVEGYLLTQKEDHPSRSAGANRLKSASVLWRQAGDRANEALALHTEGQALRSIGRPREASEAHRRALALWRAEKDIPRESYALFALGMAETALGRSSDAVRHFEQALVIERSLRDRDMEAEILTNLGAVHETIGDRERALKMFQTAVPAFQASGNTLGEMRALASIGFAHDALGNEEAALDHYRRSLDIAVRLENRRSQALLLGNIGRVYVDLGDSSTGMAHFEKGLAVARALKAGGVEATMLLHMGRVHLDRGDLPRAAGLFEAASRLFREASDARREAVTLEALARVHLAGKEPKLAVPILESALVLAGKIGERSLEARILTSLGSALASLGKTEAGIVRARRGQQMQRDLGERFASAASALQVARIEAQRGRLRTAREIAEPALRTLDQFRGQLTSLEFRASYLGTIQEHYAFYVDLLMRLHRAQPREGFDRLALEAVGRGKARAFLDLLSEAGVRIRQGIDPALLERERLVQRRIAAALENASSVGGAEGKRQAPLAAATRMEALLGERDAVISRIRSSSPRYAALRYPAPLDVQKMQSELDDETLLVEFSLGEPRSYAWVVSRRGLTARELPGRERIEGLARGVHGALSASPAGGGGGPRYAGSVRALSEAILDPIADLLGDKRLVIVPDGALWYVPFAVLHDARAGTDRIVLTGHEILVLPSASVLPLLRSDARRARAPRDAVAVFADPVFDAADERVVRRNEGNPRAPAERDFPRLVFSRREAESLIGIAGYAGSRAMLDFDASLANLRKIDLARFGIVHFATHGVIDTDHPELSGLMLSRVTESGSPQEGFLRAFDIYDMNLSADLVVMSACRTALGKEVRGEGLIGLTRGFFYAGAARVMASLWRVDDAATAELMRLFYASMLGQRKLSPAGALRDAQRTLSQSNRWKDPYYWSGFVLQGEWR